MLSDMTKIILLFLSLLPVFACSQVKEVNSYEECIAAGNPILKTYPPKCKTEDGRVFLDQSKKIKGCEDRCGDRICQEIVCMALGCPCTESKEKCPEDCDGK